MGVLEQPGQRRRYTRRPTQHRYVSRQPTSETRQIIALDKADCHHYDFATCGERCRNLADRKPKTSDECYDVGKNRGRKEIDSSNRTQAYTRIQVQKENAIVVDHDNHKTEIWRNGELRARYETGTQIASNVVEDLRNQDAGR